VAPIVSRVLPLPHISLHCNCRAYSERVLLEQLQARARGAADPAVQSVLVRVASLFAVWTMERDLAWFLMVEVLQAHHANTIHVRFMWLPPAIPLAFYHLPRDLPTPRNT
jgi:hypothetical protein